MKDGWGGRGRDGGVWEDSQIFRVTRSYSNHPAVKPQSCLKACAPLPTSMTYGGVRDLLFMLCTACCCALTLLCRTMWPPLDTCLCCHSNVLLGTERKKNFQACTWTMWPRCPCPPRLRTAFLFTDSECRLFWSFFFFVSSLIPTMCWTSLLAQLLSLLLPLNLGSVPYTMINFIQPRSVHWIFPPLHSFN